MITFILVALVLWLSSYAHGQNKRRLKLRENYATLVTTLDQERARRKIYEEAAREEIVTLRKMLEAEQKGSESLKAIGTKVLAGANKRGFTLDPSAESMDAVRQLALVHSEVSEAVEEMRKPNVQHIYYVNGKPEGVGPELADVIMRVAECAVAWGIDLDEMIRIKHNFNEGRPFKHGGKRF